MTLRLIRSLLLPALCSLTLSGCGWHLLCPNDVPMTSTVTEHGPFATNSACNTARTGANPCTPITGPDAACTTYCRSGAWPGGCFATATNASSVVAPVCYPKATDQMYYYQCTNMATCCCK
jgi:hypothetical protein